MLVLSLRVLVLNIRDENTLKDLKKKIQHRIAELERRDKERENPWKWSIWFRDEAIVESLGQERAGMILKAYEIFGRNAGPFLPPINLEYAKKFADAFAEGNQIMAAHGCSVAFTWHEQGGAAVPPSCQPGDTDQSCQPGDTDQKAIDGLWKSDDEDEDADGGSNRDLSTLVWAAPLFGGGNFDTGRGVSGLNLPLVYMAYVVDQDPSCEPHSEASEEFSVKVSHDLTWDGLCQQLPRVS